MDDRHDRSPCAVEQVVPVQLPVSNGEEYKAEERVEGSAEQGQEVPHAWDDLRKDEADDPDDDHDCRPDALVNR